MSLRNTKIRFTHSSLPMFKRICLATCTLLCACPLLMACQGLQAKADRQTNSANQQERVDWNLSSNAEYTYQTILFHLATLRNDVGMGLEAIASMEVLARNKNILPETEWYADASTFLYTNHEKELAQAVLRNGIERYPDDATLVLLYSEASKSINKPESAVLALQDFYATHNDDEEIRLELIKASIANKQFTEAEDLIKSIPPKEQSAILHYYYAKAAVGLQNTPLAITQFSKAIKNNPKFAEAYAELAYIYETQKDYAKAEQTYKNLMDLEGSNIDLWLRIINMNIKLQKPKTAYSIAMQGVTTLEASSPDKTDELMLRATHIFLDAEYFSQAKDMLNAITKKEHAPQEAYFFLGAISYEHDNKLQDALTYLEKINTTSDYHNRALQLRAQIEYELGQHKNALDIIERATLLYPQEKIFYDMHAQIYVNAKQNEKALAIIDDALQLWPKNSEFLSRRGSILEISGKSEEAFLAMQEAVKYDPPNAIALNYVAYMLAEKNENLELALNYAQKAIELDPTSGHIMDTVAWAHYKLGHFSDALTAIKKALELGADEADIWEHYGDITLANGDEQQARKGYTNALARNPKNASEIAKKLQELTK